MTKPRPDSLAGRQLSPDWLVWAVGEEAMLEANGGAGRWWRLLPWCTSYTKNRFSLSLWFGRKTKGILAYAKHGGETT